MIKDEVFDPKIGRLREMQESEPGIVRDIIRKSAEGLKEGLICNGSWLILPGDSKTAKMFKTTGYDEEDFFKFLRGGTFYVEGEYGDFSEIEVNTSERSQLLEDGLLAQRCAEGELMVQTAVLGGTQEDYNLSKNAVTRYLQDHPVPVDEDGECEEVRQPDGTFACVPDNIAHWNDSHMVPTVVQSEAQAIEIGIRMSEVFHAAADRL